MKLRLLLFILSMFTCAYGQQEPVTYSAFAIDNKEVIWVQSFPVHEAEGELTDHVYDLLKRKSWMRNLHFDGSELVGDIQNFRADYKRYGGKYMNTSNLIRTGRWSGKARINFKDGKYRVIVYGIEYDARQPVMHAGKMSNQPHMVHGTLTDWALNSYRSRFKKSRHNNLDIIHFNLKDAFTLKETEVVDDDW